MAASRGVSLNRLCARILESAASGAAVVTGTEPAGLRDRLADRCREIFGRDIIGLVLFGSAARGQEFPDSDIDLLVVLDGACPLRRGLYSRWGEEVEPALADLFDREVSPHFCHLPAEPNGAGGLWLEVAIDGIVLWEESGVVSQALRGIRAHTARGGATRHLQHGHPYWVRRESDAGEETSG